MDDGNIVVEIWDATGNKKITASLPAHEPVNRIMVLLVEKMNLPRHSPDGQLMSYKFDCKATGQQLLDEQPLADAGIHPDAILRIQPEITAGRSDNSC